MTIPSKLPTTFEQWLRNQYTHNTLADITNHGAQSGFTGLIYYDETSSLYDHYSDEIWQMIEDGVCAREVTSAEVHFPLAMQAAQQAGRHLKVVTNPVRITVSF